MKTPKSRLLVPLFFLIAVGLGVLVLARRLWGPSSMRERRIRQALEKSYRRALEEANIPLSEDGRFVIFSDHHKGARNGADDFEQCEVTYLAALDHYLRDDYTLVILGDAEELWEEPVEPVIAAYCNVLQSEARFYPERYLRVHGNHDDLWLSDDQVRKYLDPFFPGIKVRDGIVLSRHDSSGKGKVFLVHGHQGTLGGDRLAFLARMLLPFYRVFQILTGCGHTTPAQDACLRSEHDTCLYRWASRKRRLVLVAGHTHRPVWSSRTHLEKLLWELYRWQEMDPADRPPDYAARVAKLNREIAIREQRYPPCNDTIKTRPCYFNTGCCRFADGDITGIEIEGQVIRLIKWGRTRAGIQRSVLEQTLLREVFSFL